MYDLSAHYGNQFAKFLSHSDYFFPNLQADFAEYAQYVAFSLLGFGTDYKIRPGKIEEMKSMILIFSAVAVGLTLYRLSKVLVEAIW